MYRLAPTLLRNDIAPGRHWLIVQCAGREGNRSAIGARLTLTTVDRNGKRQRQVREIKSGTSYLSHNDLRVHFGLGAAASAEELRVRWASGKVEVWRNLEANQILTSDEGKPLLRPSQEFQFPPMRAATLKDQVARHIRTAILQSRLEPGARIVESRLAAQMQVAQTTVREAIQDLETRACWSSWSTGRLGCASCPPKIS